jgi:hypothetical protein
VRAKGQKNGLGGFVSPNAEHESSGSDGWSTGLRQMREGDKVW